MIPWLLLLSQAQGGRKVKAPEVITEAVASEVRPDGMTRDVGPPVRSGFVEPSSEARWWLDADGVVTYRPSSRAEVVVLPFSEPIETLDVGQPDLPCGRTRAGDTLCLRAAGSLYYFLTQRRDKPVTQLRFEGLALTRNGYAGPCLRMDQGEVCGELRYLADGEGMSWKLVNPREPAARAAVVRGDPGRVFAGRRETPTSCRLLDGTVRCDGPSPYGERGDGELDLEVRTAIVPGISEAEVLVATSTAFCVLQRGRVWCWGAFLADAPVPEGRRLPVCAVDDAASERVALVTRLSERLEAVDSRGMGAPFNGPPWLVYEHTGLCVEPGTPLVLHPEPVEMEGFENVRSLAANEREVCIIAEEKPEHCVRAPAMVLP